MACRTALGRPGQVIVSIRHEIPLRAEIPLGGGEPVGTAEFREEAPVRPGSAKSA